MDAQPQPQPLTSSMSLPPNPTSPQPNPTPPPTSFRSAKRALTTETVIKSIEDLQVFIAKAESFINTQYPLPRNSSPANGGWSRGSCFNMGGSGAVDRWSIPRNGADDAEELRVQAEQLKRELNYLDQATRMNLKMNTQVKFDFKDPELQLKFLDLAPSASGSIDANVAKANVNGGASGDSNNLSLEQVKDGFDVISKTSFHLKELMRTILKEDDDDKKDDESVPGSQFEATYIVSGKPKTFLKEGVLKSPIFIEVLKDFQEAFKELPDEQAKLCLLSLSVFPANAIITKKVLFYWWMGEEILLPFGDEEKMNGILKKLVEKDFIEPVIQKCRLIGFMMDPLVRLVVVNLAERAGLLRFDDMAVPTEDMSSSDKTFLVKTETSYSRSKLPKDEVYDDSKLEKIRTLFNVNNPNPDFEQDKFSKMKNVNVLYLGRWQEAAKYSARTHHIEVDKIEFLKGLKNMKHLIFISFRGISRISNLPGDDALSNLTDLRVLDFSACYGLESLPNLSFLQKLTYLDLSDCYLLDHIPKGISSLLELRVLKGFLISDSADDSHSSTLQDLERMKNLRKLSIKSSRDDFPTESELKCLQRLYALEKLTITWGGKSSKKKQKGSNTDKPSAKEKGRDQIMRQIQSLAMKTKTQVGRAVCNKKSAQQQQQKEAARARWKKAFRLVKGMLAVQSTIYLKNLYKLDLQCFPRTAAPPWLVSIVAPSWLTSRAQKRLKKLYISGGNLQDLGMIDGQPFKSTVKILRLKYLDELRMDWRELQDRFPDLVCLEKARCPKLTFFPCDKRGVWLKKDIDLKQLEEMNLGLSWSFLTRKSFETLGEDKRP